MAMALMLSRIAIAKPSPNSIRWVRRLNQPEARSIDASNQRSIPLRARSASPPATSRSA
jgi:hypothetical protein